MRLKADILVLIIFFSFVYRTNTDSKALKLTRLNGQNFNIREPMADFTPIFKKTEKFEGGYQNYASDKANYTSSGNLVGTNRGISAIAYENYLGYEPSVADMKAITERIARNVYVKKFWATMRGNEIKDQDVADIIFAVRIGNPAKSNTIVQNALADNGIYIKVNWLYTAETIKAINKVKPKALFYSIKERKRVFLESLRYSYPQFINGWMRKLNDFEYDKDKKKWLTIVGALTILISVSYYMYKK